MTNYYIVTDDSIVAAITLINAVSVGNLIIIIPICTTYDPPNDFRQLREPIYVCKKCSAERN